MYNPVNKTFTSDGGYSEFGYCETEQTILSLTGRFDKLVLVWCKIYDQAVSGFCVSKGVVNQTGSKINSVLSEQIGPQYPKCEVILLFICG